MRIDVWYGKHQVFGRNGLPQRWINLLGRVYGPVKSLHAVLNGGPLLPLSIGPDERRLVAVGDFNVDLDSARLKIGDNLIDLVAVGEGFPDFSPVGWRTRHGKSPSSLTPAQQIVDR